MKHKIEKSHYCIKRKRHICRFCSTPIAKLRDGKLTGLGNKGSLDFLLENGTLHRIEGCKDCIKKIDFKRYYYLLKQCWQDDCKYFNNECDKYAVPRMPAYNENLKPLKGFAFKYFFDREYPINLIKQKAKNFLIKKGGPK